MKSNKALTEIVPLVLPAFMVQVVAEVPPELTVGKALVVDSPEERVPGPVTEMVIFPLIIS